MAFIGQNLDLQGGGNSVFCVTTQLNAGSVFRVNLHGLTLKMATVCPARWLLPTPQNIRCSSQQDYGTNQPITFVDEWNTNLMSLAILFHFLCAQHVSGINISIFRSLRLCWWIITSVVLFSVRCVLELLVRLVLGCVRFAGFIRTLIYPSSGACDCVDELPHRSSCSQFVVCWSFWCGWF